MYSSILHVAGSPIEEVVHPQGRYRLLSKTGPVELIEQTVMPGNTIEFSAPEHPEAHEHYHILEGSMSGILSDQTVTMHAGDTLQINQLDQPAFFQTVGGVRFLCVTTHPTFHLLSQFIQELHDIVKKVEEKDPYTKDHGIRVQDWSYKIAVEMGLPHECVVPLCHAALFHDIGKIHIPDHILGKPGRLTDEEYVEIKKHPGFGAKMVMGTILDELACHIGQHHERPDGTGYPEGRKDCYISLEARIISVADVFDAMTTNRPYRSSLPVEVAVQELTEHAGTHYDSKVVDALLRVLSQEGLR